MSRLKKQIDDFIKVAKENGKPIVIGEMFFESPVDVHICHCGKRYLSRSSYMRHAKQTHPFTHFQELTWNSKKMNTEKWIKEKVYISNHFYEDE